MGLTLSDLQTAAGVMALVLLLVQLVKRWVPEDYVQHCAVVMGTVIGLLAALALGCRDLVELVNAALTGLFGGAAAVGLYDLQKPLGVLAPKGE